MKIGFIGAGKIARIVADTLVKTKGVELYAVAARDLGRAQAFAGEFGFKKAYGSYEELVRDDAVELVYINTTTSQHAEQMQLCIGAGKPVLCEKAFTTTAAQAQEVLELAKEKRVFVGEAIWPRYMPLAKTLREVVDSGRLGGIVSLHANLGYPVYNVERLHRPELTGGALLDIGIYPLTFASVCFGDDIESFRSNAIISDTGVDKQEEIQLVYKNGRLANLFSTCISFTSRMGSICGTHGYAVVENVNNYRKIDIYDSDNQLVETIPAPEQISGYEYQFLCAQKAIASGKLECEEMPHSLIIGMMDLMDRIRHSWGMYYPIERA